ncbi:mitogen-activated protein kinase kinase kinase 20-like [Amphiura filiformis]|uniref:mitogen-activated protein kinase kinase kinase 20-like n=1 Tax=Amphiura filiformis TaxID=82378 RepID=UPI003B226CB4
MELCHKGSLRSYLNKMNGEKLAVKHFFEWSRQAAQPIKYLKEMKIIHKDIKSPNYLITHDNILKLCDFGSAKMIEITINNATMTASYAWMAPELLRDGTLSPSYDIYSFGVVIWELWTALAPFYGMEPQFIVWRICNDDEKPAIPDDCPKPLADLMKSCWQTDWHMRPSIDQILEQLSSTTEQEVILIVQQQFIAGPWEKENEFGLSIPGTLSDPKSVTVNTEGDIVVVDALEEQVKVFSMNGQYRLGIDTTQSVVPGILSKPWCVSVSSQTYFLTDSTQYVHVYNAQGCYGNKWVAISPEHKASDGQTTELQGLTIDENGDILVGESTQRYISVHKQDGVHIFSIKTNIRPHF